MRNARIINAGIALLSLLLSTVSISARTFTNKSGKTIKAEITGATDSTATLKLASGKTARVNLDTLSEADQDFVRDWLKNRVPRLQFTPKLVRSNRNDNRGDYYYDEGRHAQILNMSVKVRNVDDSLELDESELKFVLIGRSISNRNQYKILAVQRATFKVRAQKDRTITFKTVKNIYEDGDYRKRGYRCAGYVLHATRVSDNREVYSHASTPLLARAVSNIIELRSGDRTNEYFIKESGGENRDGSGVITVE